MCVAIAKNIGVELPSIELMKNCFLANPEGAGYAYCDHGSVVIRKGFMTWADFAKEYESLDKDYLKQKAMLMHFRIGTHGLTHDPKQTHPFPMTDDYGLMQQLNVKTKAAVLHNGILYGYGKTTYGVGANHDDDYSDTMEFIKEVLLPLEDVGKWSENKAVRKLFGKAASALYANKFAILRSDGSIQIEGEFVEHEGVFYSNRSFETKVVSYGKGYGYGYGKDYDWSTLDDNGWEWDPKSRQYIKVTEGALPELGKRVEVIKGTGISTKVYFDKNSPDNAKDPLKKLPDLDGKTLSIPSGEKFSLREEISNYLRQFEKQSFQLFDEMFNAAGSTIDSYEKKSFNFITVPTKLATLDNPGTPQQTINYVFNYPFTNKFIPTRHRPLMWLNEAGDKALLMWYDEQLKPWYLVKPVSVSASFSGDFECDWAGLQLAKVVFNKLKSEGKFKAKKADKGDGVKELPKEGSAGTSVVVPVPTGTLPALTKEI